MTQDDFSIDNPPWNQPELASKYPDIETLLAAMDDGNVTTYAAPFNYLRSFHPKGELCFRSHILPFRTVFRVVRNV